MQQKEHVKQRVKLELGPWALPIQGNSDVLFELRSPCKVTLAQVPMVSSTQRRAGAMAPRPVGTHTQAAGARRPVSPARGPSGLARCFMVCSEGCLWRAPSVPRGGGCDLKPVPVPLPAPRLLPGQNGPQMSTACSWGRLWESLTTTLSLLDCHSFQTKERAPVKRELVEGAAVLQWSSNFSDTVCLSYQE